ncbi:L-gulonolactone oxidase 3 [Selaginella moellendorffii]|nr:L-gulonolactone oxidase 3 [Selaginella moellendorffii]|eukprot:XP_002986098.2 L-gulonolactone oxidase 3 [Selaginella moellendorffii]
MRLTGAWSVLPGVWVMILLLCCSSAVAILPISCGSGSSACTLQNYQGIWYERALCGVANVAYPTTEAELVAAVASGVQQRQKIKVVSKLSHSLVRAACPGGSSGLLISTSRYDSRIVIDSNAMTVTADAGVQLQDLLARLAAQNLALPCTPYFNGLSIAGVISTGSHGSSLLGKGGAVHDYVSGITIVVPASREQGYAKVIKLGKSSPDLNAAKLSIGVLGAISTVTLDVEPMFKRSITKQARDDSTLENDVAGFASRYAFGDINWYISQKKILLRVDNKVSASTPGEGRNAGNDPAPETNVRQSRVREENFMSQMNASLVCQQSLNGVENRVSSGDGLVNDRSNTFRGYPVVGFNHQLQTAGGCQNTALNNTRSASGERLTCYWDPDVPGQFYFQTSLAIPLSRINEAIQDIKKIRDGMDPTKLCGANIYGGAQLRFIKGSTAYLAEPEDSVAFELLYFRDRRQNTPRLDQDATDEIEQMLLKKYKGRPHWGKNKNAMFEDMGSRVTNLAKFLEVRQRYDPDGYFSSEWSDAVLGIKQNASVYRDYCALEGLCLCKEDRHCAPERGFLCKPGLVFTDARVCRRS